MAKYDFRGKDAQGTPTNGQVDAESHSAAEALLRTRGIEVTLLKPSNPTQAVTLLAAAGADARASGTFKVVDPRASATVKTIDPRASGSFRAVSPPPAPSLTPPAPAFRPASAEDTPLWKRLAPVFLVGGAVLLTAGWLLQMRKPWGPLSLRRGEAEHVLEVKGAIALEPFPKDPDPWKSLQVTVILPEVETEFQLDGHDLKPGPSGNFDVKLYYLAGRSPGLANVVIRRRGYRPHRRSSLPLQAGRDNESVLNLSQVQVTRTHAGGKRRKNSRATAPPPAEAPSGENEGTEEEPTDN